MTACELTIREGWTRDLFRNAPLTEIFNAAALELPLTIVPWRDGDSMQPLGAPGTRKLKALFRDRGIPVPLRRQIPVVHDTQGPIWVAGISMAARVRVQNDSRKLIRLSWEAPASMLPYLSVGAQEKAL